MVWIFSGGMGDGPGSSRYRSRHISAIAPSSAACASRHVLCVKSELLRTGPRVRDSRRLRLSRHGRENQRTPTGIVPFDKRLQAHDHAASMSANNNVRSGRCDGTVRCCDRREPLFRRGRGGFIDDRGHRPRELFSARMRFGFCIGMLVNVHRLNPPNSVASIQDDLLAGLNASCAPLDKGHLNGTTRVSRGNLRNLDRRFGR